MMNHLDNFIAETTPDGILLRPAITLPVEIYTEVGWTPEIGPRAKLCSRQEGLQGFRPSHPTGDGNPWPGGADVDAAAPYIAS